MEKILVQILDDEVYKIIARKTAGMYFGETAMKSKDCIRTATIISSGLCHVAIIKKDTFDEVLKQSKLSTSITKSYSKLSLSFKD